MKDKQGYSFSKVIADIQDSQSRYPHAQLFKQDEIDIASPLRDYVRNGLFKDGFLHVPGLMKQFQRCPPTMLVGQIAQLCELEANRGKYGPLLTLCDPDASKTIIEHLNFLYGVFPSAMAFIEANADQIKYDFVAKDFLEWAWMHALSATSSPTTYLQFVRWVEATLVAVLQYLRDITPEADQCLPIVPARSVAADRTKAPWYPGYVRLSRNGQMSRDLYYHCLAVVGKKCEEVYHEVHRIAEEVSNAHIRKPALATYTFDPAEISTASAEIAGFNCLTNYFRSYYTAPLPKGVRIESLIQSGNWVLQFAPDECVAVTVKKPFTVQGLVSYEGNVIDLSKDTEMRNQFWEHFFDYNEGTVWRMSDLLKHSLVAFPTSVDIHQFRDYISLSSTSGKCVIDSITSAQTVFKSSALAADHDGDFCRSMSKKEIKAKTPPPRVKERYRQLTKQLNWMNAHNIQPPSKMIDEMERICHAYLVA